MKVILANGTELTPIVITGGRRMIHGVNRDVLFFVFPTDVGMEYLDSAFTESTCENINIVGDDGSEAIHKGYTIRVGLNKEAVMVADSTPDTDAVYEDRITVSIGQRTYTETKLAEQQAALNALLTGEG